MMSPADKRAWVVIVLLIACLVGGGMFIMSIAYCHDHFPWIEGEQYQLGDRSGWVVNEYPDGTTRTRSFYTGGWRDGEHTEWHSGRQRREHGFYDSGKRIGTWESWHSHGARRSVTSHDSDGAYHGETTGWYFDGGLHYHGFHEHGKQMGTWSRWYPTGCPHEVSEYDEGGDVSVRYWHESGAARLVTSPVPGAEELLRYTFFDMNGTPQADGKRLRSGGLNRGEWRYWTDSGELDLERSGLHWRGHRLWGLSTASASAPAPRPPPRLIPPQGSRPLELHSPQLPRWQ